MTSKPQTLQVEELGFDEGDAWLNIELERGTSTGDVIEGGE